MRISILSVNISRRAFTLTELLISISIIGVLVAILLSVIQSVSRKGGQARCTGNLRAIVQIAHAWSADHDQYCPQANWYAPNIPSQYQNLCSYGLTAALLKCPASTLTQPTYGINANLVSGGATQWGEGDVQYWARGRFKMSQLSIATTILFADTSSQPWSPPENTGAYLANANTFGTPHLGKTQVAYVDGHVEAKTIAEASDAAVWSQGTPSN